MKIYPGYEDGGGGQITGGIQGIAIRGTLRYPKDSNIFISYNVIKNLPSRVVL